MLCHKTPRDDDGQVKSPGLVCQGWVRVMGMQSIGVRLSVMRGAVTIGEVEDYDGPTLFDDFASMMAANGVDADPAAPVYDHREITKRIADGDLTIEQAREIMEQHTRDLIDRIGGHER